MKLLTRHYKLYLYIALPLFLLVAVGYYFLLLQIITKKADESLLEDKQYIITQINQSEEVVDFYLDLSDDYIIRKTNGAKPSRDRFSTIMIFDALEEENEPYRQLHCFVSVRNVLYELTLRKSLVEYNSIMYSILILGIVFSVTLVFGFMLLNKLLAQKLWLPFYKTVNVLGNYSLEAKKKLDLPESQIDEFRFLNSSVSRMSEKIRNDFIKQKKFIDHVAHEIQTPLSVVNANIENILQSKNLSRDDYQSLDNIAESTTSLSKVVKSLLLLSRIENDQFEEKKVVDLHAICLKHIRRNNEHFENKSIDVHFLTDEPFLCNMNQELAEVLIGNLTQNMVRYSAENSQINIQVKSSSSIHQLILSNIGKGEIIDPSSMFDLFKKNSDEPDAMGIGLSIVKEICLRYHIGISYEVKEQLNTITLEIKSSMVN